MKHYAVYPPMRYYDAPVKTNPYYKDESSYSSYDPAVTSDHYHSDGYKKDFSTYDGENNYDAHEKADYDHSTLEYLTSVLEEAVKKCATLNA